MESQRSMRNSITQENTTETLNIDAKLPLTQKHTHMKPTGQINPTGQSSENALKTKRVSSRTNSDRTSVRNKNIRKDLIRKKRIHSSDEMNESCSNITATTYINGNVVSTNSCIGLDFDSSFYVEQKLNCDRESVLSGTSNDRFSHRSHDRLSESRNLLPRREQSYLLERDMDKIDLLDRERSTDLREIIECERPTKRSHKKVSNTRGNTGVERRKLPDIAKITAATSPKRMIPIEQTTNFPNFVFTHQSNEFAEAQINRSRISSNDLSSRSQNNSQTSFGKQNSESRVWSDEINAVGNVNRVKSTRSIDLRRSSTKSIHDNRITGGNNYTSEGNNI